MLDERRYPGPFELPIIIPKSPVLKDWLPAAAYVDKSWLWIAGLAALMLLLPDRQLPAVDSAVTALASRRKQKRKTPAPDPFSDLAAMPRMRRGNRLFYMWRPVGEKEAKSQPRSKIHLLKSRAKAGDGTLFLTWAKTADQARVKIRQGEAASVGTPLAGRIMNCGVWQSVYSPVYGKEVFRCLIYGPACNPPSCVEDPAFQGLSGALMTCVETKRVYSPAYARFVERCARFEATCTTKACLPETMAVPELEPHEIAPTDKEIRAVAESLAEEATYAQKTFGPTLSREIMDRGGIRAYKAGYEKEEYREIPIHLRRKGGLPLDEMASEMGIEEKDLVEAIYKAYPRGQKVKRKFTWRDFEPDALDLLWRYKQPRVAGIKELVREIIHETTPGTRRLTQFLQTYKREA